uniref:E3 ubiquitin-protein ligase n=1 Tax=Aegilops tauschii subsp. strangulata TaxID=200361 RepID=A0A453E9D3_AEGTS
MDHPGNVTRHDHTIDIPRNDLMSPSTSRPDSHNQLDELNRNRGPSNEVPPVPESSGTTGMPDFQSASFVRRDQVNRQQNPLNSGLWISIELIVNVSQIIAAVTVLSVSRNEHPRAPLFEWVVGYIIGCVATIPHLYWRYLHRNCQNIEQEPSAQGSSQRNISESDSFAAISSAHASEAVNEDNNTGVPRNNFPIASPRGLRIGCVLEVGLGLFLRRVVCCGECVDIRRPLFCPRRS